MSSGPYIFGNFRDGQWIRLINGVFNLTIESGWKWDSTSWHSSGGATVIVCFWGLHPGLLSWKTPDLSFGCNFDLTSWHMSNGTMGPRGDEFGDTALMLHLPVSMHSWLRSLNSFARFLDTFMVYLMLLAFFSCQETSLLYYNLSVLLFSLKLHS